MNHDVMRFAQVATRVWGCQMDFEHPEVTAKAGIEAFRNFLISIGMPKNFEISSPEIYEALKDIINEIFHGIVSVLEQVPPELYSDICSEGILLSGGLTDRYRPTAIFGKAVCNFCKRLRNPQSRTWQTRR